MANVTRLPDAYKKFYNKTGYCTYGALQDYYQSQLEDYTYSQIVAGELNDSNNYKLLYLNEMAANVLNDDMTDVYNALDVMEAEGATLDLYGQMVQQYRGALSEDSAYRIMILNKIAQNACQCDYNTVITLLAEIFNCSTSEIGINDVGDCTVKISDIQLETLAASGFTLKQAVRLIERLLPVCVKVSDANFEGTFEFCEDEDAYYDSYDEETTEGFADDDQTIGGYLGLSLGDDDSFNLPL